MATSSFFYGSSPAPEQSTLNELIADLEAKVAAAQESKNAAAISAANALASANNSKASENSVSALLAQAQATLNAAIAAQQAAEQALAASQAAIVTVNAGVVQAESAKVAAQAAQALAQTAKTNAETAEVNAEAAAAAALVSQNSASASATAASTSATAAQTAENNAELAEVNAELAQAAAEFAKSGAETAATAASGSATIANNAANTATTAATASAGSATASAGSATNSANSATAASGFANNASDSANLAEDWANKTTGTVDGVEYSAKKYAQDAATAAASVDVDAIVNTVGELTADMSGFLNRTSSTISFNNGTRTLTLTPTTATLVYYRGLEYTIAVPKTLQITNTTGGRYINYDPVTGLLVEGTSIPNIRSSILVAYVYWDAVNSKAIIVGDERHSVQRDTQWHYSQHRDVGAIWRSGGAISYTLNSNTVSVGFVTPINIADEDLEHTITHSATPSGNYSQVLDSIASLPVIYLNGTGYVETTPATDPWVKGSVYAAYNLISGNSGSLADSTLNKYISYWVVATNDKNYPVKLVMGRGSYNQIDDAYAEVFDDYGLSLPEFVTMYQVILKVGTYTNNAGVQIVGVRLIEDQQASALAFSASSHNSLTDRSAVDQHPISAITGLQTSLDTKANTSGSNATGTWAISVSGNAATATTVTWSGILSTPTTVSGYGITDAITTANIGSQSVNYAITAGSASTANSATTASTANALNTANSYSATRWSITADSNNYFESGGLYLRASSPTVYFRDTEHNSAMIHCNSNILYVLRGGNDTTTWAQVNGYWPVQIDLTNNNMQVGGAFTAISNVTAYSDERLKKDWADLSPTFLEDLAKVKHGTYTRIDTGERQVGASAQGMKAVLPESVQDGEHLSLAYGNAALVAAIELSKEVVLLRKEIEELKKGK